MKFFPYSDYAILIGYRDTEAKFTDDNEVAHVYNVIDAERPAYEVVVNSTSTKYHSTGIADKKTEEFTLKECPAYRPVGTAGKTSITDPQNMYETVTSA